MKYIALIPLVCLLSACGDPIVYPDECQKLFETMKICTATGMQDAPTKDVKNANKFIDNEVIRLKEYLGHYQDNIPRMSAFCTTAEQDLKAEMSKQGVTC